MAVTRGSFDRRWFLRRGLQATGLAVAGPAVLDAASRLGRPARPPEVDLGAAEPLAAVPTPRIFTRAEWGADESIRRGTPEFAAIQKLVVHHTAVPDGTGDPATEIGNIYRNHVSKGWNDIGYNFVIDRFGRVFEGRWARNYAPGEPHSGESTGGQGVIGAHAASYNRGTVGIALLGNFQTSTPTAASVESLIKLLAWIADRHRIDPMAVEHYTNAEGHSVPLPNIFGHGDVRSTSCPGSNLHRMLDHLRHQTALTIGGGFIGYRLVSRQGDVVHFGGARDYGDLSSVRPNVVGADGVPNGQGYLLVDDLGGVYAFGGATYHGSIPELRNRGHNIGRADVIGIASTPAGGGYWLYDAVGGIFSFGNAGFFGSVPGLRNQGIAVGPARITTMAATRSGRGYWVLDEFGGVFAFGDAQFHGSLPAIRQAGVAVGPNRIISMAATPRGGGYWMLDEFGGVFSFGDAGYHGSLPQLGIRDFPVRRIVASASGRGYVIVARSGAVYSFGDAPHYGAAPGLDTVDVAPVLRR